MTPEAYWLLLARSLYVLSLFLLTYLTLSIAAGVPEVGEDDIETLTEDEPRVAIIPLLILVTIVPLGTLLR